MKILLLLSLLLLSFLSYSQHVQPEKGDDIVIIATRDSLPDAFRKLQITLQDAGYTITTKDAELFSLQTDYLPIPKKSAKLQVSATIRAQEGGINYITLQGKWNMSGMDGISKFSGPITGADKYSYLELEKIAKLYPKGEVYYSKR